MNFNPQHRELFDRILDSLIAELPEQIHHMLEEVPLIVEDEPSEQILREMGIESDDEDLCGLHWGVPLTERGSDPGGGMPDHMMIFRGPIMRLADFHGRTDDLPELEEQIRITLLHEIGHHFGLEEEDLARLGYE